VLIYKNKELIEEKHLHGGNTFAIELECDTSYTFEIKKNFYDSVVLDLSTDTMPGTLLEQEIKMRRARCLRAIVVNITGSGALLPLTDVELTLRQGDRVVETLTGTGSIQFQSSLSCDRQYRITALKDGYRPFNRSLNISSSDPELIELDVRMIPEIEIITRRGERMISTNRINFELNEFEITDSGADELDKLITYLKKYPAIRIEVRNHTDSRAPDDYNMTLSENRALAISNYLVAGGIGPDRVRGKGLGETRLLNKCANGVDCTQEEHEVNRRTEFVILEY
jgi:outer membrane protein OmpA-like peptidoglycan-associated protein